MYFKSGMEERKWWMVWWWWQMMNEVDGIKQKVYSKDKWAICEWTSDGDWREITNECGHDDDYDDLFQFQPHFFLPKLRPVPLYCAGNPPASFQPVPIQEIRDAPEPVPPVCPLTPLGDRRRFRNVDDHAVEVSLFSALDYYSFFFVIKHI